MSTGHTERALPRYPSAGDATADRLARWHTVQALRVLKTVGQLPDQPDHQILAELSDRQLVGLVATLVAEFRAAFLLRALARYAPAPADVLAGQLVRMLDDQHLVVASLQEWLAEYGYDLAQITPLVLLPDGPPGQSDGQ